MEKHFHIGRYFLPGLIIIFGVILADQYTKWLVTESLLPAAGPSGTGFGTWLMSLKKIAFFENERAQFKIMTVLPLLNFVMVWNRGISFGLLGSQASYMPLVFIALSLVVSMLLLIWLALNTQKSVALALGLVIGGALGNVIDRVRFDAVADFIDVHWQQYHWPAFNVADSCIVLGAGLLMLLSFTGKEREKR